MLERELLSTSGLFDTAFYLEKYRDVANAGIDPIEHYLTWGANEGRRPHPSFDGEWYRRHNPEVARAGCNPLVHYLRQGKAEGRPGHKRTVVYSAIVGNYDELRRPRVIDPELDYVVFTDDWVVDVPEPWLRQPLPARFNDDCLDARFVKTHPHLLLPEYEISIWIDAAFELKTLLADLPGVSLRSCPIAFFAHPERDCAYDEADVVWNKRDSAEAINRVVRELEAARFPRHAGLAATGFLVRKHRDGLLIRTMEEWWDLIVNGSRRDQLSINFLLWKNSVGYATLPGLIRSNEWADWIGHRPTWKGLQCGGAYLDRDEYQAIEEMVRERGIRTAIETGAGETSVLFSMLGVRAVSIECSPGPWLRRARDCGCTVAEVPFHEGSAVFQAVQLARSLQDISDADLLFIDSPNGTSNRRNILSQILSLVRVRYVLYHDLWRDAVNVFRDQQRFDLRLIRLLETQRGLALFEIGASHTSGRAFP